MEEPPWILDYDDSNNENYNKNNNNYYNNNNNDDDNENFNVANNFLGHDSMSDDSGATFIYEDYLGDGADYTYFNPDGSVLNVSNYEIVGVYDIGANFTGVLTEPFPTGRAVALCFFVLLFLVGIIGNALVICTVVRFGNMRKVTYLYLVNLAVADLLYLLVCLPTLTASYILVQWPFGFFFCRLENYLMSVSMSVSVLTIVATSLDRYMAILHPVRSKPFRTIKVAMVTIGAVWVASLCLLPARLYLFDLQPIYQVSGLTHICGRVASQRELKIDTALVFLFLYLLPQLILAVCHLQIGRKLWTSQRPGLRLAPTNQRSIFGIRERRRIAKIMIVITIVFGLGWLPVHIYHLVEDFDNGNILFGEYLDRGTVALFFSFGANSLNPFFYCVFSSAFRKHFKQALLCRRQPLVTNLERVGVARGVDDHTLRQSRTPIVLLPRPASILPSPPPRVREETSFQLKPLLKETDPAACIRALAFDNMTPVASPLSVEELTGIRVADIAEHLQSSSSSSPATHSSVKHSPGSIYIHDLTSADDDDGIVMEKLSQRFHTTTTHLKSHEESLKKDFRYLPNIQQTETATTTTKKISTFSDGIGVSEKRDDSKTHTFCLLEQRHANEAAQKQRPLCLCKVMNNKRGYQTTNFYNQTKSDFSKALNSDYSEKDAFNNKSFFLQNLVHHIDGSNQSLPPETPSPASHTETLKQRSDESLCPMCFTLLDGKKGRQAGSTVTSRVRKNVHFPTRRQEEASAIRNFATHDDASVVDEPSCANAIVDSVCSHKKPSTKKCASVIVSSDSQHAGRPISTACPRKQSKEKTRDVSRCSSSRHGFNPISELKDSNSGRDSVVIPMPNIE